MTSKINVILIGFMACGKTTIGKELSNLLGYEFLDTDALIEKGAGTTIKEIFNTQGESCFRALEALTLEQLQGISGHVISVGGGAVVNQANFNLLHTLGVMIFLDTPFEDILRNLKGSFRPLIGDRLDAVKTRELYDKRLPIYQKADYTFSTANKSISEISEALASLIRSIGR